MKPHIPVFSALILTACASVANGQSQGVVYQENPNPQEGYRIRIVITDAPGGFAHKKGLAQYDVTNRECLPPPKENAGGRSSATPTHDIDIPLAQISANEYEAVVYKDGMQDANLYGYGICRWELIGLRIDMKATGKHEETRYIPSISEYREAKISSGQTETVYFNKISYPKVDDIADYPNFGAPRHRYNESVRDEDLFSVSFIPTRL